MKTNMFKRIAALAAAAVMTLSMTAFGANPASGTKTDDQYGPITEMGFQKTVSAKDDVYYPVETFNWTIANGTEGTRDGQPVLAGVTGGVSASSVTTATTEKGTTVYSTPKFTFDASVYTAPGIYHYTVTETKGTNKHIGYDTAARDLYVYVQNAANGGMEVYGAALELNKEKSDNWTNTYKYNTPDIPTDEFKDLSVTKTITGDQADTTKKFNFKITVTAVDTRTTYTVVGPKAGSKTTLTSGTPFEIALGNNETVKVIGLAEGDTYTVTEDESNQAGYTTKGEVKTATAMGKADVSVTVNNNRDSVTPTGIVLQYAPYILMILAAGVLAVVFLRRRDSE